MRNIDVKYLSEVMDSLNFSKEFNERQKHIENLLCAFLNIEDRRRFYRSGNFDSSRASVLGRFCERYFRAPENNARSKRF